MTSEEQAFPGPIWTAAVAAEQACAGTVMTVSLSEDTRANLPRHVLAPSAPVSHVDMADIEAHNLTGVEAPALILSPLVAPGFDAMDLLTYLREIGFAGRYLVLAPAMPDIPLIRAEMTAQSEHLDIDIISLTDQSVLHLV